MNTSRTGEVDELDIDKVMETENLDDMEFTKEDEAEVDRMVDEFNDVAMDETMMDNDDLLIDEPGMDAEKIDAISQLSPAAAEYGFRGNALTPPIANCVPNGKKRGHALASEVSLTATDVPADQHRNEPLGQAGRKVAQRGSMIKSTTVKGASASRKMNPARGRQSPKKQKSLGKLKNDSKKNVPRTEVFPSAKSKNLCVAVSGSVVSQKPPSKKI